MTELTPQISTEEAFALMLETACEDFEILQALIGGEIQVAAHKSDDGASSNEFDFRKAHRAARAGASIRMALAKSFVFYARRANEICASNKASLALDRADRVQFLKATESLTAVRDVNEHGFDGNSSKKPSLHSQEGGMLDETAMIVMARGKILMGPLNLYTAYLAIDRMRKLAGFNALYEKKQDGLEAKP